MGRGAQNVKRVALQGNMTVVENVRIGEIQCQIIVSYAQLACCSTWLFLWRGIILDPSAEAAW